MMADAGNDSLEELLLKWEDRSISSEELKRLTSLLVEVGARTRLSAQFRFEAELAQAWQSAKWRDQSREQAERYQTMELAEAEGLTVAPGHGAIKTKIEPWGGRLFSPSRWRPWKWILPAGGLAIGLLFAYVGHRQSLGFARVMVGARGITIVRGEQAIGEVPDGFALRSKDRIQLADDGQATLFYLEENTQVQLRGPAQLELRETREGKNLRLHRGSLTARVAPQPADRPMILWTPQAELTVLGTEFTLSVVSNATRLDVIEGALRMACLEDGKEIKVHDGYFAVVSPGLKFAEQRQLPEPWNCQNVGLASRPGHAVVEGRQCRISSWGHQRNRFRPNFNYVYRTLEGDGEIRARVLDFDSRDKWTKAGVVIREDLKSGSPTAFLSVKAGRGLEFWSWSKKSNRSDQAGEEEFPYWVRLVRRGDTITAYKSPDGVEWIETGSDQFEMGPKIYVGLGVTAFNPKASNTAVFDNIGVLSATNPVAVSLFEQPRQLDVP